jgi:ATP-binding cassette subfamily C (CFTR/MRP) protein 1
LDSQINESQLSLGHKQLIVIARGLIKNRKLRIIDEGTSSLDHETNEILQTVIRKRMKNCTVLTITH